MGAIGFIGLGIMGKPMAGNLARSGHTLYVYDTMERQIRDCAALGASPCKDPRAVAEKSEVVFLMLPDTPDVEAVLFGEEGVAWGVRPGSVVVDMSSISPIETRRFASRLASSHVEMLDAPVSGGRIGAEQGTLSIMVGGKPEVFERVKPLFEVMGRNIIHIGPHGDGQACKVANQILVAGTIAGVSEALLFASKAGADPAKVRQALLGGFAQSKILEVHGERMIKGDFRPGFRVSLHQKDLNIALQAARALCVAMPVTAIVQELLTALAADGGADLDHSAIIQVLERLANHRMAEQGRVPSIQSTLS